MMFNFISHYPQVIRHFLYSLGLRTEVFGMYRLNILLKKYQLAFMYIYMGNYKLFILLCSKWKIDLYSDFCNSVCSLAK